MTNQHPIIIAKSGRQFAASAAGLVSFILDEQERILMLANPKYGGNKWEPPNGAYNGNETLLEAAIREAREEAGANIRIRPLCVLHAYNFPYDNGLRYMISVAFLFAYLGGDIIPGDDMAGSDVKWMTLSEIHSGQYQIIVPQQQEWLFDHAVEMYRLLKDRPAINLQPTFTENMKNKYGEYLSKNHEIDGD